MTTGMDQYIRKEIKKIFPQKRTRRDTISHAIFKTIYFPSGLPKIHEHDGRPQAFGILSSRLVLLYTFECDLGDGWESQVHNDPTIVREKA
jgi:hypothetical protein